MTVLYELLRFLVGCYFVRSGAAKMGGAELVLGGDHELRTDRSARGSSSCIYHSPAGVLRRPCTSLKCITSALGRDPFSSVVHILGGHDYRLGQKKPSRRLWMWHISDESQCRPCRAQHNPHPRADADPHITSPTGRHQEPRTIMPCRSPHRHSIIVAVQKAH